MEIKKVTTIGIVIILLSVFLFSDNTQYKQIGNTNFYLMPNNEQGDGALLYHNGGEPSGFYPIPHEGTVDDVYWNSQFIIIKCSQTINSSIEHWYLINNIKEYKWEEFEVRHFSNINDYASVLDSIGLYEKDMEHTDGTIHWRIHF